MATIRKDGKAYDSGDVEVVIDGKIIDEVKEISYSTTQEHQKNKSLKNRATSWSMGGIDDEGSITLYMTAARTIEKTCNGDLLSKKPFDINVTYVNEYNELVNDTIQCKFQSQGRSVTGEMGLTMQYTLFVLRINYGNQ